MNRSHLTISITLVMTIEDRGAVILTILLVFLGGVVLMALSPTVNAGTLVCFLVLIAAGVVGLREVRTLKRVASPPAARSEADSEGNQASAWDTFTSPLSAEQWSDHAPRGPVGAERRSEAIELDPDDTVEQIARTMIKASFRQASLKYHPDVGGTNDLMKRIVQARKLLLSSLARN